MNKVGSTLHIPIFVSTLTIQQMLVSVLEKLLFTWRQCATVPLECLENHISG